MTVERLFNGEKRYETILDAILEIVYERGEGLPIPTIIGILELCKCQIINKAIENE
jgi:hypothetical protein